MKWGTAVVALVMLALAPDALASGILYHSNQCSSPGGPICDSDIYSLDPDTGASTQLTSGSPQDYGAKWSPDGSQIVFARSNGSANNGFPRLYLMAADGSGVHAFTHPANGQSESQPSWAPLGTRIAYSAGPGTPGGSITTVGPDGAAPLTLTPGPPQLDINPLFTPDGTRILFVRYHFGAPSPPALWSVSVAGGPALRATGGDVDVNFTGYDLSPDCHTIAFGTSRPDLGGNGIYTLDFATSRLQRVTTGLDTSPVWSPDGNTIAFARSLGQEGSEIFKADVATGTTVQLTHAGASPFPTSWAHTLLPDCRASDLLAPVIQLVGPKLGQIVPALPSARRSAHSTANRRLTVRRSALHMLAVDLAGLHKLRAALVPEGTARRIVYHAIPNARAWKRLVAHARPGRYAVRFLTSGAKGKRTRRPLVAHVTLKR